MLVLSRQVCAEQQCEDEVFPLSVNYLDRVLSVLAVRRSQLQLVAAVCMFLASKFKDTTPLSAQCLVVYTDCSVTLGDLLVRDGTLVSDIAIFVLKRDVKLQLTN